MIAPRIELNENEKHSSFPTASSSEDNGIEQWQAWATPSAAKPVIDFSCAKVERAQLTG